MQESILLTVKKLIGLSEAYDAFDIDLIIHINSVLMILYQLGIGERDFEITGPDDTWEDFLGNDVESLKAVRTYVVQKTRMVFDPPTNSNIMSALKDSIAEFEWRLNVQVDPEEVEENE